MFWSIHMTSKNLKLVTSFTFAILIGCILLYVLISLRDTLSWLASAFGLAAGWAAGFLLAPYQSEQQRFREYVKFISVFISGYLVSKIDWLFDLWFDPEHGPAPTSFNRCSPYADLRHEFCDGCGNHLCRAEVCQLWSRVRTTTKTALTNHDGSLFP